MCKPLKGKNGEVADFHERGNGGHPQEQDLELDGSPGQSTRAEGQVG